MENDKKKTDFDKRVDFGNFDSNLEFLKKTGLLNKNKKILEIGSGTGRMLSHFIREGYTIKGLEKKETVIEKSKILYGDLPIQKVNSEILPFPDNSFDIVISFDVFEHIPDSDNHLKEVSRVLASDGYYLLQTPNKYTNSIFETIRWKSFTKWKSDHCSLHSYNQIVKRFNNCGFSVEFIKIPIVNEFFKRKIKRYLGNFGLLLIKIINPDKLPANLQTNFYVVAKKNK
jgi:SAM-dependent methyltransferase